MEIRKHRLALVVARGVGGAVLMICTGCGLTKPDGSGFLGKWDGAISRGGTGEGNYQCPLVITRVNAATFQGTIEGEFANGHGICGEYRGIFTLTPEGNLLGPATLLSFDTGKHQVIASTGGQIFNLTRAAGPTPRIATASGTTTLPGARAEQATATSPAPAPSEAPHIDDLSPRDRFVRLADRIETALKSGDTVTALRFMPMAEGAFANLSPTERDIDSRFHLGIMRALLRQYRGAAAQADTIAAGVPTHLFVDYLRAVIADKAGDTTGAVKARATFRGHYANEIAINRPEYAAHRNLLDAYLKAEPVR